MKDFLLRAWANPATTFGIGGAILTLLIADLADGAPWSALKTAKLLAGIVGIFGAAAARDSATPAALNAPAPSAPKVPPLVALMLAAVSLAGCVNGKLSPLVAPIVNAIDQAVCRIVPIADPASGAYVGSVCDVAAPLDAIVDPAGNGRRVRSVLDAT